MIFRRWLLLIIIGILLSSCNSTNSYHDSKTTANSELVFALQYILKKNNLPKEFYAQPLQIIKNPENPFSEDPIIVNGRHCIIIPEQTNIWDKMRGMDIFRPIPLVEISKFSDDGQLIKVTLTFRTIEYVYDLMLKKGTSLRVIKYEKYQI